jgi:hypothetical protein
MKQIPVYTKDPDGEITLEGTMSHVGDINIFEIEFDGKKDLTGYGLTLELYKGYISELDGYVVILDKAKGKHYVSEMNDWVTKGNNVYSEAINFRGLEAEHMTPFDNHDEAFEYIKRNFIKKPAKKTGLTRLG